MCEARWKFYDPQSGPQTIGIYHGAQSGHVLIYQNDKIVIIDFEIFAPKTYSIHFNDSLIQLSIKQIDNQFSYSFDRELVHPSTPSIYNRLVQYVNDFWKQAS